jgi:hypothetical protein
MEKSFWQKLVSSFNPDFLGKIAYQSLSKGFKYLLFLLFLISLILSLKYTISFSIKARNFTKNLPIQLEKLRDFPEITIQEGKILSPKEKFLKEWKNFIFVIDPTGEVNEYLSIMNNYEGGIVIIPNRIVTKSEKEKIEIYDISKIPYFNFKFNSGEEKLFTVNFTGKTFQLTFKEINHWVNIISLIFLPLFFFSLFFTSLINKLFQIFLFSFLPLIVNKIKKLGLKYQNLLSIGIFALTPSLVLETFIKLVGTPIPHFRFIYYMLYAIYLIVGTLKTSTSSTYITKE